MNKKGSVLGIIIFMLIAFAFLAWAYSQGFKNPFGNKTALNETNITDVNKVCEICDFPKIDMAAVYFDENSAKGLNYFIENSNTRLYCVMTELNNKDLADRFVAMKQQGKDVKVYFGIDKSMKDCDILCVPKLESQYSYLLGEGVAVNYGRVDFNYCINEKAVFLFSYLPGSSNTINQNYGLIIFSPQLMEKYKAYYEKITGENEI